MKASQDAKIRSSPIKLFINAIKAFMSETMLKAATQYLALVGTAVEIMKVAQHARKLKLPRPEGAAVVAAVAVDSSLSCMCQQSRLAMGCFGVGLSDSRSVCLWCMLLPFHLQLVDGWMGNVAWRGKP
jgi:hypothetical protein